MTTREKILEDRIRPFELDPESNVLVEAVPIADQETLEPAMVSRPRRRPRRWLAWLLGAGSSALLLALVIETIRYVHDLLLQAPILGTALAVLTIMAVVAGIGAFGAELRALRKLRRHEQIHQSALRMTRSELHGEAQGLLGKLSADYEKRPELRPHLQRYQRTISDAHNDREAMALFEQNVLQSLDREAYRVVLASSRDIGIITALSPLGLIDSALVLIRALMMLRAIARLYGVRPSAFATAALLRRSLRNAALAGLTELVADAAVETAGASLASLVSARAGQGMGNGLLAGRLGIEAIKLTRPLPFIVEEAPRLRHIRQSFFEKSAKSDR